MHTVLPNFHIVTGDRGLGGEPGIIIHILRVGHFVIRAKYEDMFGRAMLDLSST